jgi:hypothetical protein
MASHTPVMPPRAMTVSKTVQERRLIERTRQLYPWFLPGEIRPAEDPPDFALHSEGERIAIEVTRLFRPKGDAPFSRRETESFQPKIMRRAEDLARMAGLPVLDVLVYFGDPEPLQLEETSRFLAEFVRHHLVDDCETFDLPDGGVIRIMRPRANQVPRWTCGTGGSEPTLTREMLDVTIRKKNADLARYSGRYDRAWLIIASTLFPLSASFSVPDAISEWRFAFDFEKVLLLSEPHGRVFNVHRA